MQSQAAGASYYGDGDEELIDEQNRGEARVGKTLNATQS